MGNKDKDKKFKKCRRKIRIRLLDPNNPNSYVCEVFDSSFENEEKDTETVSFLPKSEDGDFKPKNYFELLMSKDCRRSSKVKVNAQIEENCKKPTVIKIEDEDPAEKNENKPKNGKTFTSKVETESSDDENLLQVKKDSESLNNSPEKIIICNETAPSIVSDTAESEEELFTIIESQKVVTSKKTLSILNYFPKTNPKSDEIGKKIKNPGEINNLKISHRKNDVVACKTAENSRLNEKKSCLSELNKENVKLAPLFYRKEKKALDTAAKKARLDFLYRSAPAVKKLENRSNDNDVRFPEVAHVQQKNCSPYWSVRKITLPLSTISSAEVIPRSDRKFRFDISDPSSVGEAVQCPKVETNKDCVRELKSKYLDLNLESVIDNLKRKRDEYFSLSEELENSRDSKKTFGNDDAGFEALNTLWIEKYKPRSSDILGNGRALKKLRGWLESWKSFDEALKALIKTKPKSRTESDDDDAFVDSDDDDYGLKPPGNVCILSGPHASGKTALVFALASELEFKVLELNASSKRTGKKVLSDLQEATQSHKVHHLNILQTDAPPRETKKKKKKKRKKSKKSEEVARIPAGNYSDCKISLILIEDADVVFEEHDEGFISAITSLVQTSKRPVIFVTQEPNCPYFENFNKDQCLMLKMERPCFYKSCAVLDVISSLEGAHTEEEFLKQLVRRNYFDLRKSLLELQFWTQCKENRPSLQRGFDLGQLWWGLGEFLYKKEISHCVPSKGCKRKRQNDLFDSSDDEEELAVKKPKLNLGTGETDLVLNHDAFRGKSNPVIGSYFKVLDSVSVVDTFCVSSCSESIFEFESRPKDSLSLEENLEEVSIGRKSFMEELSQELVKLSTKIFAKNSREKKNERGKFDFLPPSWEEIRWQQSQNKASEELSALVHLQSGGDRRSLRLDYLPIVRNICRIEKSRSEVQPKRKNRQMLATTKGVSLIEQKRLQWAKEREEMIGLYGLWGRPRNLEENKKIPINSKNNLLPPIERQKIAELTKAEESETSGYLSDSPKHLNQNEPNQGRDFVKESSEQENNETAAEQQQYWNEVENNSDNYWAEKKMYKNYKNENWAQQCSDSYGQRRFYQTSKNYWHGTPESMSSDDGCRLRWGDRGLGIGHLWEPVVSQPDSRLPLVGDPFRQTPKWVEKGLKNADGNQADILIIHHPDDAQYDPPQKNFLLGQNAPIPIEVIEERERKRKKALEHQNAIKRQLEEREMRRRQERENRIREEKLEEERIKKEQEIERLRYEEEQRKIKQKEEIEKKKEEVMREAIKIAEKRAKEEKILSKRHQTNSITQKNHVEFDKKELAEKGFNNKREIVKTPRFKKFDDEADSRKKEQSEKKLRDSSSQFEEIQLTNNFQLLNMNGLPVDGSLALMLDNPPKDNFLFPADGVQLALLMSPRNATSANRLIPNTPLVPALVNTGERTLTPSKYRITERLHFKPSHKSTQTDLKYTSAWTKAPKSGGKDKKQSWRSEVHSGSSGGSQKCNIEKHHKHFRSFPFSKYRLKQHTSKITLENRPKWGINRPSVQYQKQSEKDPYYQRKMKERLKKAEEVELLAAKKAEELGGDKKDVSSVFTLIDCQSNGDEKMEVKDDVVLRNGYRMNSNLSSPVFVPIGRTKWEEGKKTDLDSERSKSNDSEQLESPENEDVVEDEDVVPGSVGFLTQTQLEAIKHITTLREGLKKLQMDCSHSRSITPLSDKSVDNEPEQFSQ